MNRIEVRNLVRIRSQVLAWLWKSRVQLEPDSYTEDVNYSCKKLVQISHVQVD
jgi:hypothetical protein